MSKSSIFQSAAVVTGEKDGPEANTGAVRPLGLTSDEPDPAIFDQVLDGLVAHYIQVAFPELCRLKPAPQAHAALDTQLMTA